MNHYQFRVAVGAIGVTWNSRCQLTRIDWYDYNHLPTEAEPKLVLDGIPFVIQSLLNRIWNYFYQGEPMGEIPWEHIDTRQWTEFQLRVYRELMKIPHGETRTYSWVASRIGQAAAPRAVGQALRRNSLPIIIPCHRIVSADALGGFMGISDPKQPELRFKRWLIENEHCYINPVFTFASVEALR